MTKAAAKPVKRAAPAKPKSAGYRPFWRRYSKHQLYALHWLAFILGCSLLWSLRAGTPEKIFDTSIWLALLGLHGLIIYRRRLAAFGLHLLMFSAGSSAIWYGTHLSPGEKVLYTLGWLVIAAPVGLWLYRGYVRRAGLTPAKPAPKAAADDQEPVYDEADSAPEYDDEPAYEYGDDFAYVSDDDVYDTYVEEEPPEAPPEAPPKRRGKRGR